MSDVISQERTGKVAAIYARVSSERQARRYVNAALERPDGVVVPERSVVFTVRLAPSLIAGLRERADSRGLTLSAAVAEAVRLYLGQGRERHGGKAR